MTALTAPYVLEYPYSRSTGPVIGRFLTELRDRRVSGVRGADGRVIFPPLEYDPETAASLGSNPQDWVALTGHGTITTWTWVDSPRPKHPLDRPFAWALITLDGADTGMLHAVDCGSPDAIATGDRVRIRWAAEPTGSIRDIACFVPEDAPEDELPPHKTYEKPVSRIVSPTRLEYTVSAAAPLRRFLRALLEKRIVGEECPDCRKVFVPPRGSCPTCAVPTENPRDLPHVGTVTIFCIINFPFPGQVLTPPYATACILLDGADLPIFHLVGGVDAAEVRMGMRVRAEWVPDQELAPTMESIKYFAPTGEPDVPFADIEDQI
jgi:uncharacterized OB-fold protein